MKNIKKIVIVLETVLFMMFSLVGCGGNNKNTYSLPDVTVGDTFEVTLSAYGSTPYQWNYEIFPTSGIEYVSKEVVLPDNDRVGGGEVVYTFKAITVGDYKIKFELRSFVSEASDNSPAETNIYEVTVVEERSTDVVNVQNFDLSITTNKNAFKKNEDIEVDILLKNENEFEGEIAYFFLFIPFIPTATNYPTATEMPPEPYTMKFNEGTISFKDNLGGYFEPGLHEIKYKAKFYVNWGEKNEQMIEVWSNAIQIEITN